MLKPNDFILVEGPSSHLDCVGVVLAITTAGTVIYEAFARPGGEAGWVGTRTREIGSTGLSGAHKVNSAALRSLHHSKVASEIELRRLSATSVIDSDGGGVHIVWTWEDGEGGGEVSRWYAGRVDNPLAKCRERLWRPPPTEDDAWVPLSEAQ